MPKSAPTTLVSAAAVAALSAGVAVLISTTRRRRGAASPATAPTSVITHDARRRALRRVRAAAAGRREDDQLGPGSYTRPPITIWRIGDRYAQPYNGGTIVGVDETGFLLGSKPYYYGMPGGWRPTLFLEELEEVVGQDYERIAARTFAVPAATITRIRELAHVLTTPDDTEVGKTAAQVEMRTLYAGLGAAVKADLITDWIATGKRHGHPASLFFLTWAALSDIDTPDEATQTTLAPVARPTDIVDTGHDPDQLWRQLCAAEYKIHIIELGNDGPPEYDRSTAAEQAEAATLADQLTQLVQIPAAGLRTRALEAAYAHGQDPGTDADPDRFAPPNWAEARSSRGHW